MNIILKRMYDHGKKMQNTIPNHDSRFAIMKAEPEDMPLPNNLEEHNDNIFKKSRSGDMGFDIVMPKKRSTEKLPVAIYFHGGGLVCCNRKQSLHYRRYLAQEGFIVYSIDYPLINNSDALGMFRDSCTGLAAIGRTFDEYGADSKNVYIFAESAGAFVSLFCTAAAKSAKLRRRYHIPDPAISINGLVFLSGMIYTNLHDAIGMVYRKDLFGKNRLKKGFMKYMNPEDPYILSLLPPIMLISSRADFLRSYSLRYDKALTKAGHPHELIYYPKGNELTHAFPSLQPSLPQSREVMQKTVQWINGLQNISNGNEKTGAS